MDRHIDNQELSTLVPCPGDEWPGISPDAVREAECHLLSCPDCRTKVSKYRRLVGQIADLRFSKKMLPGTNCPEDDHVDWHEVATRRWPEFKARQLIIHAAHCDHCGPLLRSAASAAQEPTSTEGKLLAERKAPARLNQIIRTVWSRRSSWQFVTWLVPAAVVLMMVAVLSTIRSSPTALSGPKFAQLAADSHRQHARGNLALDVRSDSQETINRWLQKSLQFALSLPASPVLPGEKRPYHLEGARLVQISGRTAALIAYQMQTGPVSLIVTPDSVAVASGGVEVDFKKVSFHYSTVEGYKVVTWSVHGLTYALVSQEGNGTQQSCMVCHSAMRDRDLSQTLTPLSPQSTTIEPVLQ